MNRFLTPFNRESIKNFFIRTGWELLLLAGATLVFALSFPNFLVKEGLFPLGFIALVPVFILVHKAHWGKIWLYGILYGFLAYSLFNYWLLLFHPLAIFIVPSIYAFYFMLMFPALKLIDTLFPNYGYILQAIAWVSYEYLRTQGYLGYPYGIIGYSQYPFLPLVRTAGITGVWGVSLLVAFPSAFLAACLKKGFRQFIPLLKKNLVPAVAYGCLFLSAIIYGIASESDLSSARQWKTALIQQNIDPWRGGQSAYEKSLNILLRLSRQAVKENPDIVIWSETSFVPSINYHSKHREIPARYVLVKELMDYLSTQDIPFVIGNNEGEKRGIGTDEEHRIDYNASLLIIKGKIVKIYRKFHLVPFTEHFPYKDILPWMYDLLINADTHFWEKGLEYTVFEAGGVKFSTPICFEDTFGYLNRRFVKHGAEVIVNMTNDSWSKSEISEIQHMTMAIFRAVENKRSVVRSTNGGITCAIDPNGHILAQLPAFEEGYLIARVPVYSGETTLYTEWEDWFAYVCMILTLCGILAGIGKIIFFKP
ncbi:MAG: apolipoprotein N-acyltransferase [Spirochaetales bacterium]|nr:apolipoprotein N-acyltransferase [Spirochaetales bacterium]